MTASAYSAVSESSFTSCQLVQTEEILGKGKGFGVFRRLDLVLCSKTASAEIKAYSACAVTEIKG